MSRVLGSSEIAIAMISQSEQQVDVAEAHHKLFSIEGRVLGNPLLRVATHHNSYMQHAPSLEHLYTWNWITRRQE
jgi:hypothetical protein